MLYSSDALPDSLYPARRFECSDCGNAYKHAQSLWKHRKFECGKAPAFPCPYCPHQAKRKQHLELHVTRKHGDRSQ
ncbi:longitudinals lacking protein, isoforms A/B/D/L-like [Frankliniella occidentalis]|uniref:Longitudinals lacking protein, isoforms A/B/D/L-like n=1 Tax=Frankliniella occidentalis TaxID=133901 RepID=A0A9C6TUH7_FRAOC|nr:longitudinals lacking protein, isoforms A/B/D/L-like [Frankliniella occidentalis]